MLLQSGIIQPAQLRLAVDGSEIVCLGALDLRGKLQIVSARPLLGRSFDLACTTGDSVVDGGVGARRVEQEQGQ